MIATRHIRDSSVIKLMLSAGRIFLVSGVFASGEKVEKIRIALLAQLITVEWSNLS